jgi:hypothetical protein
MAGKLKMLVGFGAGYVIGARAGRERYDQIAGKAQQWWRDPRIQEKAEQAQQVVKERVGDKVSSKVNGGARRAGGNNPASSETASAGVSSTGTDGGPS